MASFLAEFAVTIADVNGDLAVSKFRVVQTDTTTLATMATTMAAFVTAISGATNGKVVQQAVSVLFSRAQILPGTTPPTDATYPSVTDGARLNLANSAGSAGHLTIPAPVEACFLPTPERDFVDPAGAAAPLIAFLKTNMSDAGGTFLNLYNGGIKVGRRARKRRSARPGL